MKKKEQQIDAILNSMNGSKRAKPRPELFVQIQNKIRKPVVKILTMNQIRAIAAVGLLLVTLNVYAFSSFYLNESLSENALVMQGDNESLISNYQIYE
ncbi:MAG: hypothetical protein AB8G11_24320 [Saprospiraceae bacterium]